MQLQKELNDVNTSIGCLNDKFMSSNSGIVDLEHEAKDLRGELLRERYKLERLIEVHQELWLKANQLDVEVTDLHQHV